MLINTCSGAYNLTDAYYPTAQISFSSDACTVLYLNFNLPFKIDLLFGLTLSIQVYSDKDCNTALPQAQAQQAQVQPRGLSRRGVGDLVVYLKCSTAKQTQVSVTVTGYGSISSNQFVVYGMFSLHSSKAVIMVVNLKSIETPVISHIGSLPINTCSVSSYTVTKTYSAAVAFSGCEAFTDNECKTKAVTGAAGDLTVYLNCSTASDKTNVSVSVTGYGYGVSNKFITFGMLKISLISIIYINQLFFQMPLRCPFPTCPPGLVSRKPFPTLMEPRSPIQPANIAG